MATDFQRLIDALAENQVDFVVIGAVALVLHGSARGLLLGKRAEDFRYPLHRRVGPDFVGHEE